MKQLVYAKDVGTLKEEGKTEYCICGGAIIAPSTGDAADSFGIAFSYRKESGRGNAPSVSRDTDNGQIYVVLGALVDKGLLNKGLSNGILDPYDSQRHPDNLKVVRSDSVKIDVFDTGDPEAKVYFQKLVSKEGSHVSAGSLVIDHSDLQWRLIYEEISYVIGGTLTVTIDKTTYYAHAGDVLFVPSGSKVVWGPSGRAKIFYAAYPANWIDLM